MNEFNKSQDTILNDIFYNLVICYCQFNNEFLVETRGNRYTTY
jgi:hypothetical protein